jgi:hypothetical protein
MSTTPITDWDSYTLNAEGEMDLDPNGSTVEGVTAVEQSVLRGWETPQGSMPWAEDEGFDIISYLNADLDATDIMDLASGMEADAHHDDRVDSITVTPTFDSLNGKLSVTATGETAEGPFKLVLEADALTATLMQVP